MDSLNGIPLMYMTDILNLFFTEEEPTFNRQLPIYNQTDRQKKFIKQLQSQMRMIIICIY
jgi:hypothetical protein